MLIPLRHEGMQTRRWPLITIGLIAINVFAFVGTRSKMAEEGVQYGPVKAHILLLAASHPELHMLPEVEQFVTDFRSDNEREWKQISSANRDVFDAWDAKMRLEENPIVIQDEMDSLSLQYLEMKRVSIRDHYAFVPAHPTGISYLTANVLHAGWLHLIGNMWFLWLAGVILEDNWGRLTFAAFYLIAGVAALEFHAWFNPGSLVPLVGASGAVAALMGAFLVRFPKIKIEMVWFLFYRFYRFKAHAYWLLPLWVLTEVFYGSLFGKYSGVAHWAHVGGFVFGALTAVGLRYSGLEKTVAKAVEEKTAWTADQKIVEATDLLERGELDPAIDTLRRHLAEQPDSADAYSLLQQAYWRKNDRPAHHDALIKLCQVHLKLRNPEAAWQDYEEFLNTGGETLPASTWLELCRHLENQQSFDRAAGEYEKLAAMYPLDKQGFLALMSAGRLCLKKLNRAADALRLYQTAQGSPVPHLDWETNLQAGITEAQQAMRTITVP